MRPTMTRALLPLVLLGLQPACDQTEPEPAGGDDVTWELSGNNNGAVLDGEAIVGGAEVTPRLHRPVAVTLDPPSAQFAATDATLARVRERGAMMLYVMVAIRNVSDRPYCFIEVQNADYVDEGGAVVASVGGWPVNGSVGRSGSVFTATCLAPSEVGWFCDAQFENEQSALFDEVEGIVLSVAADPDTDLHEPSARLTPLVYTFDADAGLEVTVKNEGSAPATLLTAMSMYLLLDDAGAPLWYHFLRTPDEEDLVIPAGGTATLVDPYITYKGEGSGMRFYFDFGE